MDSTEPHFDAFASESLPSALLLSDESTFRSHDWVKALEARYDRDSRLANHAKHRIVEDLTEFNSSFVSARGRVQFTSIEARVKTKDSFFRKLFHLACEKGANLGVTQETLASLYDNIRDLCGVRFACPYYDEIVPAVLEVRNFLVVRGYATQLGADYPDRNYLDTGDAHGYRSYHFFIKIPAVVDIYGARALCLAELQGRSELQHVWAVKSHDLLYKNPKGWNADDTDILEDMRQVSNNLRAADQFLLSIRNRVRRGGGPDGKS